MGDASDRSAPASLISGKSRQLLDLVNRLHDLGSHLDVDLPQIAVIGIQSAGKSSLIEAISGITLPRASGTCTRCPTECRLSASDTPWCCSVTLRFIVDGTGKPLARPRIEPFGAEISDPAQVEERIRRAQRAILNPSHSSNDFLVGSDEDLPGSGRESSFSANYISISIKGPNVADLSFVDLPGLIASTTGSQTNSNDVALVQELVSSYIAKPSCIILLTVACETDFETQGAYQLAKRHDPNGQRTVGVLTKPDRIPVGDDENWLGFLRNEKGALVHNWYCVKQPNTLELKDGITWEQARQREDAFFLGPPWTTSLDRVYQKYLRTENLVKKLSVVLAQLIELRLPDIQRELDALRQSTLAKYNALGPGPSADPTGEVMSLLTSFVIALSRFVEGLPHRDGLLQSIRPAQLKFRRAIRETAPDFRPFERESSSQPMTMTDPLFLKSEEEGLEEEEDAVLENTSRRLSTLSTTSTSTSGGPRATGSYTTSISPVSRWTPPKSAICIDEVYDTAQMSRTRELPGNYPFYVQLTYIDIFTQKWRQPAFDLATAVYDELGKQLKALAQKHFHGFGRGLLEQRVKTILLQWARECLTRTEEKIQWLLEVESRPYSLNTAYLKNYQAGFLEYYRDARNTQHNQLRGWKAFNSSNAQRDTHIAAAIAALERLNLTVVPNELYRLLPQDMYEPALKIMSDVRAYFQVSYKRFTDNIPLAIDQELIFGISRGITEVLHVQLGIQGSKGYEVCAELAQEDPILADQRLELSTRLERIDRAIAELP